MLEQLIHDLRQPGALPDEGTVEHVIQTHTSVVLLGPTHAYKLKKPVDLGFVDLSTADQRAEACREEVRINTPLAPDVYLGVSAVVRDPDTGRARLTDAAAPGQAIDWAVKMRRLPEHAHLRSRVRAGQVRPIDMIALAKRLATFHHAAPNDDLIREGGSWARLVEHCRENIAQSAPMRGRAVAVDVFNRVQHLIEQHLKRLEPVMRARMNQNTARETHGDLRLEHVYLFPDAQPPHNLLILDSIEFDADLRYTDPVADIAFLAMELRLLGELGLARVFTQTWFEQTNDVVGAALLDLYMAYRAIARAQAEGERAAARATDDSIDAQTAASQDASRAHWLLALALLTPPRQRPGLVLMAGLPGTGKSTLSRLLADHAHMRVYRSDIQHKATQAHTDPAHASDINDDVYDALFAHARDDLSRGKRVIIDAGFWTQAQRQRFLSLAASMSLPSLILHIHASPDIVQRRLEARAATPDAFQADWATYQRASTAWEPLDAHLPNVAVISSDFDLHLARKMVLDALARAGMWDDAPSAPTDAPSPAVTAP